MSDNYSSEVQGFELRPRFYREGEKDFIEITAVGGRDTVIHKVGPADIKRFAAAWEAYTEGKEMPLRKGTALTELPQINAELAKTMIDRGVHNLEEVAFLSDAQCQGLGHGTMNLRKQATELLMTRKAEEKVRVHDKMSEANAPVSAPSGEVAALSAKIDQLAEGMAQTTQQIQALIAAMSAPKRGRKHDVAEPVADSQ